LLGATLAVIVFNFLNSTQEEVEEVEEEDIEEDVEEVAK
jgi:hypothetical protein